VSVLIQDIVRRKKIIGVKNRLNRYSFRDGVPGIKKIVMDTNLNFVTNFLTPVKLNTLYSLQILEGASKI
jgi:hypothetical protein